MDITTLTNLQTPDDGVRRFTPLGLSMAGMLSPEAAAEFQQRAVASAELVESVPDATRTTFERLRTLHSYGILCYDAFTAASQLAPLVADQALRERFIDFHAGSIASVARDGGVHELRFGSVAELVDRLQVEKLRLRDWPKEERFKGGFGQLLRWARSHDLLSGQRARHAEMQLVRWRNRLAHPDGHVLVTPVDSARSIHNLAELINRLWGAPTPGGRLYPAPVKREILALSCNADGSSSVGLAASLGLHSDLADATVLLVRGVREDEGLFDYDADYEATQLPTDLLWGPGSCQDAILWLAEERREADTADHLDRWFVVRADDLTTDRPRLPPVFAGLLQSDRAGRWHLLRADFPNDAYLHVRYDHQPFMGPCGQCAAEGRAVGRWAEVLQAMSDEQVEARPQTRQQARMPGRYPT